MLKFLVIISQDNKNSFDFCLALKFNRNNKINMQNQYLQCHGTPTVKPARAEVRDSRVKSVLACSDASPRKTRVTYASNTSCQLLHGHTTTYTIDGWVGPSFIMSLPRNVLLTMCAVSVNHKVNKWTNERTIQNKSFRPSQKLRITSFRDEE